MQLRLLLSTIWVCRGHRVTGVIRPRAIQGSLVTDGMGSYAVPCHRLSHNSALGGTHASITTGAAHIWL